MDQGADPRQVQSVAAVVARVKQALRGSFEALWVQGEVSNFRAYASGHWYFTIKDREGQLKGVCFARDNRRIGFEPKDGDEVLVRGRIDVYERRGDLQMVCDAMEPVGAGRLQAEFEALKARLQAEGLFDAANKKPLPAVPRRVGIVTSEKAAALQDMLRVLRERDPTLSITLAPARVQGDGAGAKIAAAIKLLNRCSDVELILCGRGGGSLEDLWAFNEEVVARAIAASDIPIIAGVGHEIDFTIADFVADATAPTPTGAAEQAVPQRRDLEGALAGLRERLSGAQERGLGRRRQRLDELNLRLQASQPRRRLDDLSQRLDDAQSRLQRAIVQGVHRRHERLASASRALRALGPMQSLSRGYAIVVPREGEAVVRDAASLGVGDGLRVRLHRGAVRCTVEEVLLGEDLDLRGRRQQ